MSKVLSEYGHTVTSTDLADTGYGTGAVDFLTAQRPCNAIITNPPFADSEKFIRHAVAQAQVVAMLLKSQYWHAQKRHTLFQNHPPAWVLPLLWRPDFMNGERGGAPTMDVLWTVWVRGKTETKYRPLQK